MSKSIAHYLKSDRPQKRLVQAKVSIELLDDIQKCTGSKYTWTKLIIASLEAFRDQLKGRKT